MGCGSSGLDAIGKPGPEALKDSSIRVRSTQGPRRFPGPEAVGSQDLLSRLAGQSGHWGLCRCPRPEPAAAQSSSGKGLGLPAPGQPPALPDPDRSRCAWGLGSQAGSLSWRAGFRARTTCTHSLRQGHLECALRREGAMEPGQPSAMSPPAHPCGGGGGGGGGQGGPTRLLPAPWEGSLVRLLEPRPQSPAPCWLWILLFLGAHQGEAGFKAAIHPEQPLLL